MGVPKGFKHSAATRRLMSQSQQPKEKVSSKQAWEFLFNQGEAIE